MKIWSEPLGYRVWWPPGPQSDGLRWPCWSCEKGGGHVSLILIVLKSSYNSCITFLPQQTLFLSFALTFLILSFWDQAQLTALLLQASVSWILTAFCNRLRNGNQKTWCWVNINKTRATNPYQLIGVKNSDSGEVSRCEFLFNFCQKHCKLLRKALSRCGRSQWSEEKQEWDIWKASCYIAGCAVRRNQNAMKWLQLLTIKCEMVLSVSLVVLKSAATKYKQFVINQPPESTYLLFVGI